MKQPAVYMLASQRNGTLYIGVTSDLIKRIWQHREGLVEGFTKRYQVKTLVWYERHATMESAIAREKAMKKWRRQWKLATVESSNPGWRDLWPEIIGTTSVAGASAGGQAPITSPTMAAQAKAQRPKPLDSRMRGNDGAEVA